MVLTAEVSGRNIFHLLKPMPPEISGERLPARVTVLGVSFVLASVWTIAKSWVGVIHQDETYVWLSSYSYGFVRRGVIGTALQPLLFNADPQRLHAVMIASHLICLLLLLGFALAMLLRRARAAPVLPTLLVGLLFATSPFLGELALHAGYPDGLLAVVICLFAVLATTLAPPWLGVLLILCCLIHELCFLLCVPIAVISLVRRGASNGLPWICTGALVAVVVTLLASEPSSRMLDAMVHAGLDRQTAQFQIATSMDQGLLHSLDVMAFHWRSYTLNGVLGTIYATGSAVLIATLFQPKISVWSTILYFASCLSGVAILAIAWDLSRLASFTTLTAFLTAMLFGEASCPGLKLRATSITAIGLVIMTASLPVCSLYFRYGRIVNTRLVESLCPVCGRAGITGVNFYNRNLPFQMRRDFRSEAAFGN